MGKKLQSFIASVKQHMTPRAMLRLSRGIFIVVVLGACASIYLAISAFISMQNQTDGLRLMSVYAKEKSLIPQWAFRKQVDVQRTVDDVITMYGQTEAQLAATQTYYDSLQQPYQHFLQYFLLPPLNIWKDKYTGKIDDTLIGKKFLINNAYLDVNLISQWTDFFKNIGQNSPKNEIKSITVGNIIEKDGSIFTMPIDVTFLAQTKRSFLLLVDKLSMTSNRANISLLNEFFYHMWAVLNEKQALLDAWSQASGEVLSQEASSVDTTTLSGNEIVEGTISGDSADQSGATTEVAPVLPEAIAALTDAELGEQIYIWATSGSSTYITDADINEVIRRTAGCEQGEGAACYFKFREKYRSLPELAYTVGLQNSNKVKELRSFLEKMPPMINVKSFTFTKQAVATVAAGPESLRGYEGKLMIDVYGKSMSAAEVSEIATYLGKICTNGTPLDPAVAVSQIDAVINQAASVVQISNEKSKQLADLKKAFVQASAGYETLPGFKKAVKLFEVYRMLEENRLCNDKQ